MANIDWNKKVKEALERTEFLAISTISDGGSWTNPVAFSYDEKMNLYFISMMSSKHSQNILKNTNVSIAVFKTERFDSGDVMGLQIKGIAQHVTSREDIDSAATYYFRRGSSNDEFLKKTAQLGGMSAEWQFFKIRPTEVWCFDSRDFGEERVIVPFETIDLN